MAKHSTKIISTCAKAQNFTRKLCKKRPFYIVMQGNNARTEKPNNIQTRKQKLTTTAKPITNKTSKTPTRTTTKQRGARRGNSRRRSSSKHKRVD